MRTSLNNFGIKSNKRGLVMNIQKFPIEKNQSEVERESRENLAALYRLYSKFGWTDLNQTHAAARVPGNSNHFFLKPDEFLMEEVTASSLAKVDLQGNQVDGDRPVNRAGALIHAAILGARPEINYSAHTHSRAGAAVSCMGCGLLPISQHAGMILPTVCIHPYQDVTTAADECEALARDIGDSFAMIMENHGLLTCGRSIGECFYYLYYLETACKIQVDVLSSGQAPLLLSNKVVDGLFADGGVPKNEPPGAEDWYPQLRWLDNNLPGFRD
jgi:ribulose-5-phosphate 4-epimerase/fuculose-1-phosphate aldolase